MLSPLSNGNKRFAGVTQQLTPILFPVPMQPTPGHLAVAHQQAYVKVKHLSKNGSTTGMVFELVVYDTLVQFGVDPADMWLSVKHPASNTEVDILVRRRDKPPIGIMLKSSLRERWKQEDRDAMALRNDERGAATYILNSCGMTYDRSAPPIVWCLTHREKATTPPKTAVKHATRIGALCHAITGHRFISIHDHAGMDRLLAECLA